jgi:hypothetical protein
MCALGCCEVPLESAGEQHRGRGARVAPGVGRDVVDGGREMIPVPKPKAHENDSARDERERARQEDALDEALKDTFPASDPVSIEQPTPPASDRDGAGG